VLHSCAQALDLVLKGLPPKQVSPLLLLHAPAGA
jgi:hypothetical protein